MKYRKFGKTGLDVSALGFGCMRLPLVPGGEKGDIDEQEAVRMIRRAIDSGVNYVDTAWPYHGGKSEEVLGKALRDGYRERVFLATKCPTFLVESPEDFDRYLDLQLKKLQTDHIDFYLLHSLYDTLWADVAQKYRLTEKIDQAKRDGRIKYAGFSFHDEYPVFLEVLDGYDWDFCQIQMNYVDVEYQATIRGVEEAGKRGLGLVIMEPLLGGKLTRLPDAPRAGLPAKKSAAEWGLDFLWNRPEVSVVLSGMSSMEQLEQNLGYADLAAPGMLSAEDLAALAEVRARYQSLILAPCTICEYCLPCPAGIPIPQLLEAYNRTVTLGMEDAKRYYLENADVGAEQCLHCKRCDGACPQHIPVSDMMERMKAVFAG